MYPEHAYRIDLSSALPEDHPETSTETDTFTCPACGGQLLLPGRPAHRVIDRFAKAQAKVRE
jgi:competence CoiA-like predicted nuclease